MVGEDLRVVKTNAWSYIDAMVTQRKSVTFKRVDLGGYAVILNGYNFGLGSTCKSALMDAIAETKKRRTNSGR